MSWKDKRRVGYVRQNVIQYNTAGKMVIIINKKSRIQKKKKKKKKKKKNNEEERQTNSGRDIKLFPKLLVYICFHVEGH